MSQGQHPLIGTIVNEYWRIERQIGEGGMGQVFIAQHIRMPQLRRVMKTLLAEYAQQDEIRARFYREAEAVSVLKHRNIIKLENFGELPNGELYLMLPLLDGRPLDAVLRDAGKLGPHHTLLIAAQIGSALRHAHDRGIVHRDLKPANVFLEREDGYDKVTLIDFGIAKDSRAGVPDRPIATRAGAAIGTPHYMACEQYRDAGMVTPAADVFALAVVIVEMLTGQLPWGIQDPMVIWMMQAQEAPRLGPEVPRKWVPILLSALSPDPNKRPTVRNLIVTLANELAALPPVWGTGADIVKRVAPDLITESAASDATIRAQGNVPPSIVTVFPAIPASGPVASSGAGPGALPAHAASMPPTVSARPNGPGEPPSTTLSASSGVALSDPAPVRSRRGRSIGLAVGLVAVAAVATFAIVQRGGREREHDAAIAPATTPHDAPVVAPIDAATVVPVTPPATAAAGSATAPAATPVVVPDAGMAPASIATTPAVDAGIKHVSTKVPKPPATMHAPSSHSTGSGGATHHTFDPNAPAGED
jgi:serine/threonine-protein kinase